ncbi:MAG: hypothetical protein KC506_00215 [Nanoarchaeota archaeon]|nr:hypothetical protein [Nanoarchaeota archaeon]
MEKTKVRKRVYNSGGISAGAMFVLLVLEIFTFVVLVKLFALNFLESVIVATTLLLGFFVIVLAVPQEKRIVVQRVLPRTEEKIVKKETVHYVDRPVKEENKQVATPVSHSYVASSDSKMFHPTSSRLARLIRPKNRVYGDTYKEMQKKGFKPSVKAKEFFKKHKK